MTFNLKILIPLTIVAANSFGAMGFCQTKSTPATVTNNFNSMFPNAKKIQWGGNKSTAFRVYFSIGSTKCEAKFDADGKWMSTEMLIKKDSLPKEIKKGLSSSIYANWKTQSAFIIYFPEQIIHYRFVVINADHSKKIISFNKDGQLIKDNFSL